MIEKVKGGASKVLGSHCRWQLPLITKRLVLPPGARNINEQQHKEIAVSLSPIPKVISGQCPHSTIPSWPNHRFIV